MSTTVPSVKFADFDNICRFCFTRTDLKSIFYMNLNEIVDDLAQLKVLQNDDLPKNICKGCSEKFQTMSLFINKCRKSELTLRQIMENEPKKRVEQERVEQECVDIKMEEANEDIPEMILFKTEDYDDPLLLDEESNEVVSDHNEAGQSSFSRSTMRTRKSSWAQFSEFCKLRNYSFSQSQTKGQLSQILEEWAINMKRKDGKDYTYNAIKTIWNTTANLVKEKFYNEFKITFDPFRDPEFKRARRARDTKRMRLKVNPAGRPKRSMPLSWVELEMIANSMDEDTPEGLQKKFFHLASYFLRWRVTEATACTTHHFRSEINANGIPTGRIEYKRESGESKFLIQNLQNQHLCPVRIFHKLMSKRPPHLGISRFFLIPNPYWHNKNSLWYKACPVGVNYISKWLRQSAENIQGIDTENERITMLSYRRRR